MKCIKGPGFRPRRPLHLKFNKLLTEVLKMDFCPHYLKGHCSGLKRRKCKYNHDIQTCQLSACSKTKCMKRHPNVCFNFLKNCCTWRKCSYLHRSPVAPPDEIVLLVGQESDRAESESIKFLQQKVGQLEEQVTSLEEKHSAKMEQMEKSLFQKHEEIAARLSDTVERVVEPLVERVANLEMENESRKKCEANSCSLVAELVEKVDKMSVSVSCLAQDTDGFRSDVEQKIKAIRDDMKAEMAENDKKQDATSSQLKISLNEVEDKLANCCKDIILLKNDKSLMDPEVLRAGLEQKMTALTKDMKENMEICVGMEDRVLARIRNDFGYLDKRIQDMLERTTELA